MCRHVHQVSSVDKKMSDFNFPSSGERLTSSQKEQLLDQVKQQVALASAQELIQKMSDKCFKKCVYKPGTSLDSSEQKCLAMCMDRYMDTWNTISRAYSGRLQREHGGGSSY